MSLKISAEVRSFVSERAGFLCEYCHTDERWQYVRFTIDHVRPNAGNLPENLALACFHCNRRKSSREGWTDPETGFEVGLFNPRTQDWGRHFRWSPDGETIIGLTPEGRATIDLLAMNRARIIQIRRADAIVDRHPPDSDREKD